MSPGLALLAGIVIALTIGNRWPARTGRIARQTLTWSIVGLGAGTNLLVIGRVGINGLLYTAVGIACALVVGIIAGRVLRVGQVLSLLISAGTAICGGSAIAAITPVVRAKDHDVSVALVTVFLLNAIALWVFPIIGHGLHLDQNAFGLWCALAIHDTSSVVGAAAQYGPQALEIATATKLARALWIVPVSIGVAMLVARRAGATSGATSRITVPWFIAGFVGVSALVTWVPGLQPSGQFIALAARHVLSATLFLMGLGLTRASLRTVGIRPLIQATVLWVIVAGVTLEAVVRGWIR